ncbi:MAG: hypothetical protein JWR27_1081, partial [Aeromicrobium sp.]|nr:hypothetical protein [Aeromicrobium sp.]
GLISLSLIGCDSVACRCPGNTPAGCPSGQRDLTVNQTAQPTQVRTLHLPQHDKKPLTCGNVGQGLFCVRSSSVCPALRGDGCHKSATRRNVNPLLSAWGNRRQDSARVSLRSRSPAGFPLVVRACELTRSQSSAGRRRPVMIGHPAGHPALDNERCPGPWSCCRPVSGRGGDSCGRATTTLPMSGDLVLTITARLSTRLSSDRVRV